MQMLIAKQAVVRDQQLRLRLQEIDRNITRLQRERILVEELLRTEGAKPRPKRGATVSCPKCGRDRDFLTDNGGYLGHVLEDPSDTESLEPGKPLFCPACGDVFLYPRLVVTRPKKS